MGRFEEGGGSEESGKLVTGSNESITLKQFGKTLFPKDISSSHITTQLLDIEDRTVSEKCDWMNTLTSSELTANEKPGGGKRKRRLSNESEVLSLKKKQWGEANFL